MRTGTSILGLEVRSGLGSWGLIPVFCCSSCFWDSLRVWGLLDW